MGDGVLAYFSWPHAYEDDAERSVHAGLALLEEMAKLNRRNRARRAVELSVRVGIATGAVVVGDLIGEGASQGSAVVGETPNLAARIQSLATANTVVISAATHDLTGGRFKYLSLGEFEIKGLDRLVPLRRAVKSESHRLIALQCSPYRTDSAFHPFARQLERDAGIQADEALRALEKLSDPLTHTAVRSMLVSIYEQFGEERLDSVEATIALSDKYGFTAWGDFARTGLGWIKHRNGDSSEDIALTEEGLAA
jgi:hypothetical protein